LLTSIVFYSSENERRLSNKPKQQTSILYASGNGPFYKKIVKRVSKKTLNGANTKI